MRETQAAGIGRTNATNLGAASRAIPDTCAQACESAEARNLGGGARGEGR